MTAIEFNSKSAIYSEFSNFHLCTNLTIDDQIWPTVEHYFQAQKFPSDSALQKEIRLAKTPTLAKRLGKKKSPHFRTDWNSVREEVMLKGLLAKFSQNPYLSTLLKGTEQRELKEKAAWDSYWGTGRTGKGKNRMGHLLSLVREKIL